MLLIPMGPVGEVHYKAYLTNIACVVVTIFSLIGLFNKSFLDGASMDLTTVRMLAWFTAPLVHENFWQYLLNLVFFWLIGQVLEGRLGFWKYFGTILVIGWTFMMTAQFFFFWLDAKEVTLFGYVRGLFAVNFGLIVVALIYVFDRQISFLLHLIVYRRRLAINIMYLSMVYLVATTGVLGASGQLSELIHFLGFLIGLFFAIFLTMSGIVPEQGANLIERVFEKKFVRREIELNPKSEAEIEVELAQQEQTEWDEALPNLIRLAESGRFPELHQRMARLMANNRFAVWDSELLRKLIQSYTKASNWEEANRYLYIFQQAFPDQLTVPLLLSWTHVQLELARPRSAMRTLKLLEGAAVRPEQKAVFVKLAERAREMVKAGILEPDA
jgi:membrane associated rhomboid family serine protease